jgi:hypothetical protein
MANVFNYSTQGIVVGTTAPYSWNFESFASNPVNGVQSSQITVSYPRQDMTDWCGNGDPVLVTRPNATLQFSYVFSNGINEGNMGFALGNAIPALSLLNNERNYYVFIDQVNQDLIGYGGSNSFVMALGNGLITKYEFAANVGQPSTCNVTVDCLNLLIQGTGTSNIIPPIDKVSGILSTGSYLFPAFYQTVNDYFEAAPSNITLSFDTGSAMGAVLSGNTSCPLQSFNFTVDMPRLAAKNLGWAYPTTRSLRWPVTVSIHADAYLNGLQIDALNRFGCPDSGWNFNVAFISGAGDQIDPLSFQFNGAKLDSQAFTARIGDYNKVSFDWTAKIYDINRVSGTNFFINYPQTAYDSIIFSGINYGSGATQQPLITYLSQSGYLSIAAGAGLLRGNVVELLDEGGVVIVQINVSGSSEVDYVNLTITPPTQSPIAYGSIIFTGVNWGTGANQLPFTLYFSSPSYVSIVAGAALLSGNVVNVYSDPTVVLVQLQVSGSAELENIYATVD